MDNFKRLMQEDLIPRIEKMRDNEEEHLQFLIENDASDEMIDRSKKNVKHFNKRLGEYSKYSLN
jgi:demethoxyubiquinone hydroxylase (CLK1/Coq7/Cat5 family)